MKDFILRDGSRVKDKRLGRIASVPDPKSKDFLVKDQIKEKEPVSKLWELNIAFDQGFDGSCVSTGFGHAIAAEPSYVPDLTYEYLKVNVYWEAQKIDPYKGGAYPGSTYYSEGTDVLSGAKIIKKLGYCKGYFWAYNLNDLVMGVSHFGPAIIGIPWFNDMSTPNEKGIIRPTSYKAGFHCVTIIGVDLEKKRFECQNSWGPTYGVKNGRFYLKFADMDMLVRRVNSESVFLAGRKKFPKP